MSMWEFEALAEMSVLMVDASDLSLRDKRNAYANIYALANDWDVSFVHFRTTEALVKASFFHRIDVTQHPDFPDHRDYFDPIVAAGKSTWISARSAQANEVIPVDSLYEPKPHEGTIKPGVWFDSTMALWPRAVEAGLLTGLATEPVETWTRKETIVRLMRLAAEQGKTQHGLLKMLHGMVAYSISFDDELPEPGDAMLASVRDLPDLEAALANAQEDWIDERFDARQALEYADDRTKPLLEWWCAVYPE